jgi:hypothetical protein
LDGVLQESDRKVGGVSRFGSKWFASFLRRYGGLPPSNLAGARMTLTLAQYDYWYQRRLEQYKELRRGD